MYHKLINNEYNSIIRDSDNAWIPLDESNTDYQAFLQYLVDNQLTINDIPNYEM